MTSSNVFTFLGSQSTRSPVAVGSDVTTDVTTFQRCSEIRPDLETQENPFTVTTLEFKGISLISMILEDKRTVEQEQYQERAAVSPPAPSYLQENRLLRVRTDPLGLPI